MTHIKYSIHEQQPFLSFIISFSIDSFREMLFTFKLSLSTFNLFDEINSSFFFIIRFVSDSNANFTLSPVLAETSI